MAALEVDSSIVTVPSEDGTSFSTEISETYTPASKASFHELPPKTGAHVSLI